MAEVELRIGGHSYQLSCADGEEAALARLGAIVDQQVSAARQSIGSLTETRQLLFAALFLADQVESQTARDGAVPPPEPTRQDGVASDSGLALIVEDAAKRIEQINARLSSHLRILSAALEP
jgi:cell division protein ZapA